MAKKCKDKSHLGVFVGGHDFLDCHLPSENILENIMEAMFITIRCYDNQLISELILRLRSFRDQIKL